MSLQHRKDGRHLCEDNTAKDYACGPAVTYCYEDDEGELVVGNGEYETVVSFCPFCGYHVAEEESTSPGQSMAACGRFYGDEG